LIGIYILHENAGSVLWLGDAHPANIILLARKMPVHEFQKSHSGRLYSELTLRHKYAQG